MGPQTPAVNHRFHPGASVHILGMVTGRIYANFEFLLVGLPTVSFNVFPQSENVDWSRLLLAGDWFQQVRGLAIATVVQTVAIIVALTGATTVALTLEQEH